MASIMKDAFYDMLLAYQPFNEQESVDQHVMLTCMHQFSDIYDRSNPIAHITSSPWILNQQHDKVLMVYHHIYQSWSWCGGHCDGWKDVRAVALKEGKEESGLQNLQLLDDSLFAIDVLSVSRHFKHGQFVNAHLHLNASFLCVADETAPLHHQPEENSDVAWIPLHEVLFYVKEEHMKPVYEKLMTKARLLLR